MSIEQLAAVLVFAAMFAVILVEKLHRTIAALVGAVVMLAVGELLSFYSQEEALAAIDLNTLGLLLGMMILVRLLEESGFFQYPAILTGKRSRGRPWLLLVILGRDHRALDVPGHRDHDHPHRRDPWDQPGRCSRTPAGWRP